jgi:excisionase family DNA binding protein
MDKTLLTVTEVARRLSLGRATTYQLVRRGELPSVRVGRAVRVPVHALEAWIAARTTGGDADGAVWGDAAAPCPPHAAERT